MEEKLKRCLTRLSVVVLCLVSANDIFCQIRFTDVTDSAGIDHYFKVYQGLFGGGICVFDLNNDGFEDLYLTSGVNQDKLYLNQGNGRFRDIFEGSGLEYTNHFVTQGVVSADVNRDGWRDLFITTNTSTDSVQVIPRAINLLFLNNGDNTFRNATEEYQLENLNSFSTGAAFGDFNVDGYPDLYVGNYFQEYEGPLYEINDATIVNASRTAHGYLLRNDAGTGFENVYEEYGLTHRGFGFGGVFTDFDNDGDQDLYVIHDFGYKAKPNYLLRNNYPKASFSYVEEAYNMDLKINAMTAAVGDYNNDEQLDYFITNIKFNRFMTYMDDHFTDRSKELGTYYFTISWGANFADFDQDGDLDLFVANGDLNPNCVPMADFLFENKDGKFENIAAFAGVDDYGLGRGSVIFDLENDGDMDLLVVNQEAVKDYPTASRTRLFRNDTESGNWLKVSLKGDQSESMGLGSRVKVVSGDLKMIREIDGGGSSHVSQNSVIAHFGLGSASKADSVIVTWNGGKQQILLNQPVNQLLVVEEVVEESKSYWGFVILGAAFIVIVVLYKRKKRN